MKRRSFLAASLWPTLALAGAGRPDGGRFVFVLLRGGMDGLAAVPAPGDPSYAAARGPLAQFAAPPLALSGLFALHPNLVQLHAMYGRGELVVVHAAGLVYRERSHFDAQQVLESGGTRPYELATGWLGRALAASGAKGLALDTAVPLVLRGSERVDTWAPSALPEPSLDLVARLETMYAGDPALAQALARAKGLRDDAMPTASAGAVASGRGGLATALARRAGEFLSQRNGPQAAVLELGGWDTHANQAAPNGALANNLRLLDGALAALRDTLVAGDAWARTAVGRGHRVRPRSSGQRHARHRPRQRRRGLRARRAVHGGRVIADWPGLAPHERFESRDLRTTTDLRAVLKGVLGPQLQVADAALGRDVFPDSAGVRPLTLLR